MKATALSRVRLPTREAGISFVSGASATKVHWSPRRRRSSPAPRRCCFLPTYDQISSTCTRWHGRLRICSLASAAHPFPTSTIKRMIVSRCVSVIRSVERIELPSTKQLMTWVRRASERRFIGHIHICNYICTTYIDRLLTCQYICTTFVGMKTMTLQIRLQPREKQAFEEAANLSGIALSAWVRERLRIAAIRELEGAGNPVPFVERVPLRTDDNG